MLHASAVHVRPRQTNKTVRTIDCTPDRDSALSKWLNTLAIEVNRTVRRQMHMNKHPSESADTIRRFARNYRNADVDFDRSGVAWLDGFIDWLRENNVDIEDSQRIFALGCFFGTCIIETIGGKWTCDNDVWKLVPLGKCDLDPFQSVQLHLQFGQKRSVLGAFNNVVN